MASRRHASLKPHLNQVRSWVEMGATDVWIAHQLGSTPASIAAFRQKNGLLRTGGAERPATVETRPVTAPTAAPKPRSRGRGGARTAAAAPEPERAARVEPVVAPESDDEVVSPAPAAAEDAGLDGAGDRPKRRRGRRGGRGRGRSTDAEAPLELEGVFEHGDEGYGLWLDGAVRDAPVYRTHWSGQREVTVRITPDEIVIRRAGTAPSTTDDDD